jgi:predicted membrane GTPase involved in stress response
MAKAVAGDIVSIAGLNNSTVTHTLNDYEHESVIPVLQ